MLFLIQQINHIDSSMDSSFHGEHAMLVHKMRLFLNERNAYITGFSLFLAIVLFRLLQMMSQIHGFRKQLKKYEAAEKKNAAQPHKLG